MYGIRIGIVYVDFICNYGLLQICNDIGIVIGILFPHSKLLLGNLFSSMLKYTSSFVSPKENY